MRHLEAALRERSGWLSRALKGILVLVVLFVLAGLAIGGYWYLGPYRGFGAETFVEIHRGMSSGQIARELASRGVVRSRWAFLSVRALHPRATLQAGEYRFGSDATPWQVFEKIRQGEVFYEDFTIPEGSNMFDIASLLEGLDSVRPADFLTAARDPGLVRDLDPQAPSLEGYLFPSTYRVTHQTTAAQLCRTMTNEFRKQWMALGGMRQPREAHDVVTLASLVEKETADSLERPLVAAVFANRLRMRMPLQCDPTTVYAAVLENRYRGSIYKSDLVSNNPYNTYTHPGLPPGPIANPGSASLAAALHPASTDYLYFVAKADGSGSHRFSATLEEHEKAVLDYRKASNSNPPTQ